MDGSQKRIYLLEKEDVRKSLLKLGMPTMIGMIVSALYNIVDAFFVGRLGTLQTAAVSLVYPLTMVGTGIGLLFGSGAGSYISRLLGKKEYEEVKVCSSIAFFSGIFLITVLVTIMLLFFNPLMNTLGATDSTLYYVREYGLIYILGLIFNVFNIIMNNMIVAEGSSSFSMTAMLFGCLTNFILDPVLIFGCHMGVSGAAIATLISQLVSTSFYGFYILKGYTFLKISFSYFKIKRTIYTEIFKIGLPVCFFQFLTGGAVSLTNIVAKPFGEAAIAAMGIVNRLMSLESNALYGFLKGYSPLVGYNYGAGKIDRVERATKTAIYWSTVINVLFGILCILFSKQFIYVFNQESVKVLEIGRTALIVDAISFMTLGIQIVIGNYFLAIGKAKQGGILSICRQGLLFIPFLLIFTNLWGMTGLIATQLVADVCATIITAVMWFKEKSLQLV
ncbi:MATE family efflux transporter [Clostridioides difficile]|nr:MATE family efflux transporter [Clostridioides difficile]